MCHMMEHDQLCRGRLAMTLATVLRIIPESSIILLDDQAYWGQLTSQ